MIACSIFCVDIHRSMNLIPLFPALSAGDNKACIMALAYAIPNQSTPRKNHTPGFSAALQIGDRYEIPRIRRPTTTTSTFNSYKNVREVGMRQIVHKLALSLLKMRNVWNPA